MFLSWRSSGCKYERCPCSSVWLQWLGLTGLSSTTRAAVDDPARTPRTKTAGPLLLLLPAYRVRGDAGPPFGANIVHVAARTPLSGRHPLPPSPPEAADTQTLQSAKISCRILMTKFVLSFSSYLSLSSSFGSNNMWVRNQSISSPDLFCRSRNILSA